jgi:hypothetical protein
MSPEECVSIVRGVLKAQIPLSLEFERSDEAIESLIRGFADLQHPDQTDWANSCDAHEMAKKILRQRALWAGRNIEPLQLVMSDDISRIISEFLDNRPIVEKSELEEILSLATADLFASAFVFNCRMNFETRRRRERKRIEDDEDCQP